MFLVENGLSRVQLNNDMDDIEDNRSPSVLSTTPSENNGGSSRISMIELGSGAKVSNDNGFLLMENSETVNVGGNGRRLLRQQSQRSFWRSFRNVIRFRNAVDSKRKVSKPLQRRDSFMERFTTRQREMAMQETKTDFAAKFETQDGETVAEMLVINPDDNFNFYWLMVVSISVIYNLWLMIARQAFSELQENYSALWFTLDYVSDLIYFIDIAVQMRTGYLEHGILVRDSKKLAIHYLKTRSFKLDVLTLLPLDLFYLVVGKVAPMLRFPRFLKVYRFQNFYYVVETRTAHPNIWRVTNLSHLLFLLIHIFASIYYVISQSTGFGGDWAYPEPDGDYGTLTRKYLRCVYWSTLTLTTIGDLPFPEGNWEYVFQICSYLIGVFVFATIVGQVGTVVENRNASRLEFEMHLDNTKQYMRIHNVPEDVQRRVQRWYDYTWERGHLSGGGDINNLRLLPEKMKTELALHVNLETLKKVSIFKECPPEFLHDLVLKMKAYIFTPGDLICRKGEVAREMFIIADGILEVTSDTGEVFTTLQAGDFFGEIGILNLDQESGANKRTADVRSVGYSELFTLSKDDVLTAIKDFPQAQRILEAFGRKRLKHKVSKGGKDNGVDDIEPQSSESCHGGEQIVGVTIEGASSEGGVAFETTIEPISTAELHRWSRGDGIRSSICRSELEAPIFSRRRGSDSSDLSTTVRMITEVYPSPAPSDVESRQSDILKNKLKILHNGKRRGSWRSSYGNEDDMDGQIGDLTQSIQSILRQKLGKHYHEVEQLRIQLRDSESQTCLLESENQKKDNTIKKLEEQIRALQTEAGGDENRPAELGEPKEDGSDKCTPTVTVVRSSATTLTEVCE